MNNSLLQTWKLSICDKFGFGNTLTFKVKDEPEQLFIEGVIV